MRNAIFFSATLALGLLAARFIGLFFDLKYNDHFLAGGLAILVLITLPLTIVNRYRYRKMKDEIIERYRREMLRDQRDSQEPGKSNSEEKPFGQKRGATGEYPSFGSRKQGLTWGGGNIKGATATRGSKRKFMSK